MEMRYRKDKGARTFMRMSPYISNKMETFVDCHPQQVRAALEYTC